ncbi:uncharacterized protein LOC6526050 [Drosophila yakuba]|uniref:Uncharacterized protein n=1 Tax=Drosophila yakuba TaxID=7245 RepID=B4PY03_DROYA|nr:uncharacterized protein LOC6526050 [Drosophila yakuba]EDX02975.1 uncharacterized protein Dyak_GE17860 [Drosophila yakuba]
MKPMGGNSTTVSFLVILGLVSLVSLASSLPMTPEQELKDVQEPLGQQQQQQQQQRMVKSEAESEFVGRIAPRNEHNPEEEQEYDAVTLVEELEAAGVKLADRRDLRKLTYTELARLLALWHLSQNRNVYNAKGPEEQPNQAIDAR